MNRFPPWVWALAIAMATHAELPDHELAIASLVGDGAVIQQRQPIRISGRAKPQTNVEVAFLGQRALTTADNSGHWLVELPPADAHGPSGPGPHVLTARAGSEVVEAQDLWLGEVWLCAGQSNMQLALKASHGGAEAAEAANDSLLRLYQTPIASSDEPAVDSSGSWQTATSSSAGSFSAVAYHLGRQLRASCGVPVGIIQATLGGTQIMAWMSKDGLAGLGEAKWVIASIERRRPIIEPAFQQAWSEAVAQGKDGQPKSFGQFSSEALQFLKRPAGLYNGMIAPLHHISIAGVCWYQGESDQGKPAVYRKSLPAFIADWRQKWRRDELPFVIIQLPYLNSRAGPNWPQMRNIQFEAFRSTSCTALVSTLDLGNSQDVHPKRKREVGERAAAAAESLVYKPFKLGMGPTPAQITRKDQAIVLTFDRAGDGLTTTDHKAPALFQIAGEDGVFFDAAAKVLDATTIEVSHPAVLQPVTVRHAATHDTSPANLANSEGLLAPAFEIRFP
jgi:sialate O-acetylesterase